MKRIVTSHLIILITFFTVLPSGFCQIFSQFSALKKVSLESVFVHPDNPNYLFGQSRHALLKSANAGKDWAKASFLGFGGASVYDLFFDSPDGRKLYVATDQGLFFTRDAGSHWQKICQEAAYVIREKEDLKTHTFVGLGKGLFILNKESQRLTRVNSFPDTTVRSILIHPLGSRLILVGCDKGIYRSQDEGEHWERSFVISNTLEDSSTSVDVEWGDEERAKNVYTLLGDERSLGELFALTDKKILVSQDGGDDWEGLPNEGLVGEKLHSLVYSGTHLYTATTQGLFYFDFLNGRWRRADSFSDIQNIHHVFYHEKSHQLYLAGDKGLWVGSEPEVLSLTEAPPRLVMDVQPLEALSSLESDPSIQQVTQWAIRYAEADIEKIRQWHQAASRKAWLPNVSLDFGANIDETVDLDRGGTSDPDRYIIGPKDKGYDWSVNASWNLGELIWNNDQTSIDSRSRLLVQLRDDILNQVTQLYFERKRLKAEMLIHPPMEPAEKLEKEIRLQELTALLDALTGGYFSNSGGSSL